MKTMETLDSLKGSLTLKIIRHGGERVERIDNLIVTAGRANLAKLLGGKTGMHVTHVGVGSGKVAAAPGDTALTAPELTPVTEVRIGQGLEAEDGSTFDDPRMVQFHFRIGTSAAVGKEIWEYGLMGADGSLFSRIVRPSGFTKTDIDMIVGFWQIQF